MKKATLKKLIIAAVSLSLFMNMMLLSSCDLGKNYDADIADLQRRIDELRKQYDELSDEHKQLLESLNLNSEGDPDETDPTESTEPTTESTTGESTTTSKKKNNTTTAKPASTTTTTAKPATTTTTQKPNDDGFGSEVGM